MPQPLHCFVVESEVAIWNSLSLRLERAEACRVLTARLRLIESIIPQFSPKQNPLPIEPPSSLPLPEDAILAHSQIYRQKDSELGLSWFAVSADDYLPLS